MVRLIQAWAGVRPSWSKATTRSARGTASGLPMPPRRRVTRISTQADGSANSANQAIPFGMWLLEWWAISCASTTRTSRCENDSASTMVLQSTIFREAPKPTAYALAWLVVPLTSSIETGTPEMPWARS